MNKDKFHKNLMISILKNQMKELNKIMFQVMTKWKKRKKRTLHNKNIQLQVNKNQHNKKQVAMNLKKKYQKIMILMIYLVIVLQLVVKKNNMKNNMIIVIVMQLQ